MGRGVFSRGVEILFFFFIYQVLPVESYFLPHLDKILFNLAMSASQRVVECGLCACEKTINPLPKHVESPTQVSRAFVSLFVGLDNIDDGKVLYYKQWPFQTAHC